MKKLLIFILGGITLFSCKKNLSDLNQDPKHPTEVPAATLLTAAQKSLGDVMGTPDYAFNPFNLFAQYWTQTTYTEESNYDMQFHSVPDNLWRALYSQAWMVSAPNPDVYSEILSALHAAKVGLQKDNSPANETAKQNQLAVVDLLMVYAWSTLVNVYGDIPYTQALDPDNLQPAYDDAATIYDDLLKRIDNDLDQIDINDEGFGSADVIYYGDMNAWLKFANSLKLKLGMMLADVNPSKAATVVSEAASADIFSSNDDNALLRYESVTPNTSPLYIQLVTTGRKDFVGCSTLIDAMNALNDPRIGMYYTDSAEAGEGNYAGAPYAENNSYGAWSHIGDMLLDPQFPTDLLDYTEVELLLAEAAERGFSVSGSAEEHYNNAIRASIAYWGGSDADADDYLAQEAVAYTTAAGSWREKIGTQKWIALYNRGLDAWTEWRRLDYPVLTPPAGMSQSDIPVRLTYPVAEQNLNGSNYNAAAAHIGGDRTSTKLFWDVR